MHLSRRRGISIIHFRMVGDIRGCTLLEADFALYLFDRAGIGRIDWKRYF
jgi:hypothetical protein